MGRVCRAEVSLEMAGLVASLCRRLRARFLTCSWYSTEASHLPVVRQPLEFWRRGLCLALAADPTWTLREQNLTARQPVALASAYLWYLPVGYYTLGAYVS